MKIYHYTKGFVLNSIFEDGFIATECKRGLNNAVRNVTDNVWLTEKTSYPKTALPYIRGMEETNLRMHLSMPNVYVDLNKIGEYMGGAYRFVFNTEDTRFKKWFFCDERKKMIKNEHWALMENVANRVGDETRKFWISDKDVMLENFTLQVFDNGIWIDKLTNCSLSNLCDAEKFVIRGIRNSSLRKCIEYGFKLDDFKKAA
jgi:hypothetical protein